MNRSSIPDLPRWEAELSDVDGPQLVLAGPGTGKTQFLARRVAHLVDSGVAGGDVLVLTFSRRAAAELEARIRDLLPRPISATKASTFHSFAHRLVEVERHRSGRAMPVLLTGPEQVRLVGRLLAEEDPASWPVNFRPLLTGETLSGEVADFAMRCQERLVDPADLEQLARQRADWRALPAFLARYHQALEELGKIDYGTLVNRALEVAGSGEAGSYRYVVVDEYQDTSPAQARLAELAVGEGLNLTVAADPHQSIYSFRGAEPGNVESFPQRMTQAGHAVKIVTLGASFRVPAPLLESARRLVAPNRPMALPEVDTTPARHAGMVEAYTFDQRAAEAEWIASEVERLTLSEHLPLRSMAVLVRSTRHLLPELSRALERRHIPHDRPDVRLVDHPAVRIIGDIVTAASRPGTSDADLAVRRLMLGPLLALPLSREREIVRLARRQPRSWPETIRRQIPTAEGLAELIAGGEWSRDRPAVDGFWHLWDHLPGLERLIADPARSDFRAAWSTFARMLERQAERDPTITLTETLEATAAGDFEANPLLSYSRPEEDRLVVTTLHQAKGVEFDTVFIADAIEGVFPATRRSRSLLQPQRLAREPNPDSASQLRARLEEERRLAYTATTRARRRVVWTATTAGIDEGERRPSRFMLAATGFASFEQIGPPPSQEPEEFSPRSLTDAEARLRRLVTDPAAPAYERLAALHTLVSSPGWEPAAFAGVAERGPDTGLIDQEIRLSPSQATLYETCPRRYALERRVRAVDAESPYLLFGSIVHEVLELAEASAMAEGRSHADLPEALDQLDAVWERHPAFGPPPLDEAWKRRARRLLEEMYGNWPGGSDPPLALEVELDTTIGDVEWVGRADRVDLVPGGIKVVDYKTSKTPPAVKEAARSLQLGYYLLAAAEHPDLAGHGPPVAAELWFPLAERRKVFPFEMGNLDAVRQALEEVAAGITSEDWTPRVSAECDRCSVRGVCPAWPDGREGYR